MMNTKTLIMAFAMALCAVPSLAQSDTIDIPTQNDKYANYVRQLEHGDLNIDYADFRRSFLDNPLSSQKIPVYNELKKKVREAASKSDYQGVLKLTKSMLGMDYTSMFAHRYLQLTYKILGDSANMKKYRDIEFGLLYSITDTGDGKTCATGWHVTQIEEEYFLLEMIGAEFQQQSLQYGKPNSCDVMDVKMEDGTKAKYYFEINTVLEQEMKMFKKN